MYWCRGIGGKMKVKELIETAKRELADSTGFKQPTGVGVRKEEDEWVVTVEIIERKSIPDAMDLLGAYDVRLDAEGNLLGFARIELRKRLDTKSYEKEE